jgi:hypothetical protein
MTARGDPAASTTHSASAATVSETARERGGLVRAVGLLPAVAINMTQMVGIGPFITIPLVVAAMGGPQAVIGWIAGALLALVDGRELLLSAVGPLLRARLAAEFAAGSGAIGWRPVAVLPGTARFGGRHGFKQAHRSAQALDPGAERLFRPWIDEIGGIEAVGLAEPVDQVEYEAHRFVVPVREDQERAVCCAAW